MGPAWIIGNGESLKPERLDALVNEVTFACGRIHLMYPFTDWRPTYYVQAEKESYYDKGMVDDFRKIMSSDPTPSCYIEKGMLGFVRITRDLQDFVACREGCTEWHLPELCFNGSSLHVAMQIATNLGYSPLYLLGVDINGEHFDQDYDRGNSKCQPELWLEGHKNVPEDLEVYNCTVGGGLDIYPRRDLWTVLAH